MSSKWDDKPYTVGKGKPPLHTRFGQEGRPPGRGGRRPGAKNADAVMTAALSAKIKITEGGKERQISKFEAAIIQLVNRAVKGDAKAMDTILRAQAAIESRAQPDATALPLVEADRAVLEEFVRQRRNGEDQS